MTITSKYPGRCSVCARNVPAGVEVEWDRDARTIRHTDCQPAAAPAAMATTPEKSSATPPSESDWRAEAGKRVEEKGGDQEEVPERYEPIPLFEGSDEQKAIWDYQLHGTAHMIINAGPGVGKTATQINYCLRAPSSQQILFVAFNRHIAAEANGKLRASGLYNVRASTLNSLGYSILRHHYKTLHDVDVHKMTAIMEKLSPAPLSKRMEWRKTLNLAEKLCAFTKNYNLDYRAAGYYAELERLADHHALDMGSTSTYGETSAETARDNWSKALDLVVPALEECKAQAQYRIDYDDQIWLPVVLGLTYPYPADMVIVDELQDLSPVQHELVIRVVGQKARFVGVGDRHQAIYGFRGSSTSSIEDLAKRFSKSRLGVREFPLTITRRCPKLHVQLAQNLFPEIQALEDAPLGEILQMTPEQAVAALRPGDLAVCRVNANLIPVAYALIRRGVRPVIKGRDIGKGLIALVDRLEKVMQNLPDASPNEMTRIAEALKIWHNIEEQKLLPLGDKALGRLTALGDKVECLMEFILNSTSVAEMRVKIENLFSDKNERNAVTLGTVHRTKGLEAARVFVLAPELIPHPAARKQWEREQEVNIAWIAATRAKFDNKKGEPGTLVFVGQIPAVYQRPKSLYPAPKTEEIEELEQERIVRIEAPPAPPDVLDGGCAVCQDDDAEPPF